MKTYSEVTSQNEVPARASSFATGLMSRAFPERGATWLISIALSAWTASLAPSEGAVAVHSIEPGFVLEGYNSGGALESGWPVAVYGSGLGADTQVTSADARVRIGAATMGGTGAAVGFAVTVEPIPTLPHGQLLPITLTISSGGTEASAVLTIVGLDELDLSNGSIIPQKGVFSRFKLPQGVTASSASQLDPEEVPNLLITGPITLQGTLDLSGKGYAGGAGGKGGSGGTSGGGTQDGHDGFDGGMGKNGGGPVGAVGGDGGAGGDRGGYSGSEGAPGGNGGTTDYGVNADLFLGRHGVSVGQLPGSGGGGGGGQGGQGGTSYSYGADGVPGHPGGSGGGALRLRGLGSWSIAGGALSLGGLPGEISNDRGGSGGNGEDGGLWLGGQGLHADGHLGIVTKAYFRLDAPGNHGITNIVTGGHGPVVDPTTLPSVTKNNSVTIQGWVMGGHKVRAVVTDLKTGETQLADSAAAFGSLGSLYVPFSLNVPLFEGLNKVELFSGVFKSWYVQWVNSADADLTRVLCLQGATAGSSQTATMLLSEFAEKVGIRSQAPSQDPTVTFPRRQFAESEPNDTIEAANDVGVLAVGQKLVLNGGIEAGNSYDRYFLHLPRGTVSVTVHSSEAQRMWMALGILDETKALRYQFAAYKSKLSAIKSFKLPEDTGFYTGYTNVLLSLWGQTAGSYLVTVTVENPGKAYMPTTVPALAERLRGEWHGSSADFSDVWLTFGPEKSASGRYVMAGNTLGYAYQSGSYFVLPDVGIDGNSFACGIIPTRWSKTDGNTIVWTYDNIETLPVFYDAEQDTCWVGNCKCTRSVSDWPAEGYAPEIVIAPADREVVAGASVAFDTTAVGTGQLSFQWRKGGVAIPGATDTSYSIPAVQSAILGDYTVVVTNTVGSVTSQVATLTFAGVPSRIIELSGDLAFGQVTVGSSATRTLAISNSGTAQLTIASINYPSGFSGNWSGGTIAAGDSRTVTVTFAPLAASSYAGSITVNSDATSGGNTLSVSGQGVSLTRIINLSGDLAFGQVTVGSSATRTFTISNSGTTQLTVTSINYPSGFSGNWSGGTIAPANSRTVTVTFAPLAASSYAGSMTVNSDATSGGNTLSISGQGASLTRIINLSGDLAFGQVTVGSSATRTFTINNSGTAQLTVTSINYPSGFIGNWSGGTIAPANSRTVTVTFAPLAASSYAGSITVNSDATSGLNTLAVSGEATALGEEHTFTTLAGLAEAGPGAIDGTGVTARFNRLFGAAADTAGNLYIADTGNNTVRKVTPGGAVTTLAGLAGARGANDGTGAAARFFGPMSVAVDSAGTVYVADTYNHTIRKVTPGGVVTTLAGLAGISGAIDGTGATARFNEPRGVAVDSAGNVYVADFYNDTIRKVTPGGVVTTLAGSAGISGSADGTGGAARFDNPHGVAVDSGGNVYVADSKSNTIRKVTPGGVVTTLAGLAGSSGFNNGTGGAARFNYPIGVAADSIGNVYVADTYNNMIRKIGPGGVVTTLAGSGRSGSVDGSGGTARFYLPSGVAVDSAGNLFVADYLNHTVRKLTPGGLVTTLAGMASSSGSLDGTGNAARFNLPYGVTVDGTGNLYVAEYFNHTIRKLTVGGLVMTLAGVPGWVGSADGTGGAAQFAYPSGTAVDRSGNVYVADSGNATIRKVTQGGLVTTLAGSAGISGSTDGTGAMARFNNPTGVAVDSAGNVYVADFYNHTIRKVTPGGVVTTLAGLAGSSGPTDGTGNTARFNRPAGVAVDNNGNVYVAEFGNSTIRKVTEGGLVTTLAGLAGAGGSIDGTGNAALFNVPYGVAVDGAGNVYVTDYFNDTIRKVTPGGVVTTLAGLAGNSGNVEGTGSAARFNRPTGVAVDGTGKLFVADSENHTIRISTIACLDRPTIDRSVGRVGQVRHLDTIPNTAASWHWSVIRRPSGSVATLSAANVRNPAFTPDVADLYVFRLAATNAVGAVSIRTLAFSAVGDAPEILTADNYFGIRAGRFGFNVSANVGQVVVLEASANLATWTGLLTNAVSSSPTYFSDPRPPSSPSQYYRVRVQ